MGCCFSHPSGPNSPYPGGAPNSSARAINPPPLALPEGVASNPSQNPSSPSRSRRRTREQRPLDQHINKPLRRHSWASSNRRWTRGELARERIEFFETRVTGRPEVWQTLHGALQELWRPVSAEDGVSDASLATAQTILTAAEISLPTGDLANGAYDPLGNYYQLPEHIVADPSNLVNDTDSQDEEVQQDAKGELAGTADDTATEDDLEAEQRRAEKGKAVLNSRETINVRARLSENGRDYQVAVSKSDNVRSIAQSIANESGLASLKKIRLAYMGKILKENTPLEAQGWQAGHIVNALVFDK